MDFRHYFAMKGYNIRTFAKAIGIARSTISSYVHRTRTPSMENAIKIEWFTNGAISVPELRTGRYKNPSALDELEDNARIEL